MPVRKVKAIKGYADSFNAVELDGLVNHESGQNSRVRAYWAGGQEGWGRLAMNRPGLQAMACNPGLVERTAQSGAYLRFGSTALEMYIVDNKILISSMPGQCQAATPVLSGSSSEPLM
jgi:hypothetical protein